MKFVLSCYGTRGDAEPGVAIARELLRRGHDVSMAVAPDLVAFAETAGIAAVAFGPDSETWLDVHRDFSARLFRNPWKIRDLIASGREDW
ncbi:MAG TPA: glycosyltransferase, partial [Nitrospiraceae bacterium]|nr:glycosyltransferase [Nitrospiraceae bacterium]